MPMKVPAAVIAGLLALEASAFAAPPPPPPPPATPPPLLRSRSADSVELSFLSGVFQNQSTKVAGNDRGGQTTIGGGVRFAAPLDGRIYWFGQGDLTLRNYSKGSAADAPSSSTSIQLGGGLRYYFSKLSESIEPYALGYGQVANVKEAAQQQTTGYQETEKNGLYYGADFGIRLSLQKEFFVDFELPVFASALFATEKTTTVSFGPPVTSSTQETKKTELYAQSTGSLDAFKVALGMRF